MKRVLLGVSLFAALSGLPARADDALVLPRGAWRFYLVPTWTTINASYDASGQRRTIPAGQGRIASFNLGYAVEYGLNSWLTTGFQWTPGTTLSSSLDYPATDAMHRDKAHLNDAFDALVGFKAQVLGSTAKDPKRATGLFQSAAWRLSVAVAAKLPLATIDWEREATKYAQDKDYLAQAADKHLVAPVFALYADRVLIRNATRELFVNLFTQYIPYLSKARYRETSLARYLNPALKDVEIDHGYDFLIEVEPRFETWASPRVLRVGLYLPVRYKVTPATALDGIDQHNSGYRATVTPTLGLFTPAPGFPVELRIACQLTFAGKNALQARSLTVVLRAIKW